MNFLQFKTPIAARFNEMTSEDIFCVDISKEEMWDTYLNSFPPGTNPLFKKRTEHDCSCCRNFIRTVGKTVTIVNGELKTIWDATFEDPAYQAVADAMAKLIKSKKIIHPFLHYETTVGVDKNYSEGEAEGIVETFHHFHVMIPRNRNTGAVFYMPKKDIPTALGEKRSLFDVFLRSLKELSVDAVETALDLIGQGSLYRGEEYKSNLERFLKHKNAFLRLPEYMRSNYVWYHLNETAGSVAKIRNTAIGTFLVDLSEGMDLEAAVRRFEVVMAPSNYKRPVALVTKAMVEKARSKIEELGLTSALERRFATLSDINVNDIIFADREARKAMTGDVFDSLSTKGSTPKNLDKLEEVSIETFINQIVPKATTIDIMVENRHSPNFVSLIAPKHDSSKPMFKWDNRFSWSYNGEMADSIKERVKRAGGNVTGDLCCRLAWYNHDDLDFHMKEPAGGREIMFTNARSLSPFGGMLDVDMNAGGGHTRTPVENIFYGDHRKMKSGIYELFVNQYSAREKSDVGFDVEFDWIGNIQRFNYPKAMRTRENVVVAKFKYSREKGVEIIESLPSSAVSRKIWEIPTQEFHRVSTIMLSPNYWDGAVGNKHYMFMIDGCINDESSRGFFNEFLRDELTPHRKVIEMVGAKAKVEASAHQLSGLGFSSTQRNELLARVKGSFTRTVKVVF